MERRMLGTLEVSMAYISMPQPASDFSFDEWRYPWNYRQRSAHRRSLPQ
jgi:hypothetical protein